MCSLHKWGWMKVGTQKPDEKKKQLDAQIESGPRLLYNCTKAFLYKLMARLVIHYSRLHCRMLDPKYLLQSHGHQQLMWRCSTLTFGPTHHPYESSSNSIMFCRMAFKPPLMAYILLFTSSNTSQCCPHNSLVGLPHLSAIQSLFLHTTTQLGRQQFSCLIIPVIWDHWCHHWHMLVC